MIGLDQLATVYTAASDGGFTVSAKTGLACRLCHLSASELATSAERDELAARRVLLWDPAYTMPDYAQVLIGGDRWNVAQGTATAPRGPSGTVIFRRAIVVRAV